MREWSVYIQFVFLVVCLVTSQEVELQSNNLTGNQHKKETKTYTFCQIGPKDMCKSQSINFLTEPQEVSLILELFVTHLKSYISASAFDVYTFRNNMMELKSELFEILYDIPNSTLDKELSNKIHFTKQFLELMITSTELLLQYSALGSPGNRLLYKIIELNIRAHALFDSQGRPDTSAQDLYSKVNLLYHNLYFWRQRFDTLTGVRSGTQRIFRDVYQRAKRIINHLRKQTPKEESIFETRCKYVCERMLLGDDDGE